MVLFNSDNESKILTELFIFWGEETVLHIELDQLVPT